MFSYLFIYLFIYKLQKKLPLCVNQLCVDRMKNHFTFRFTEVYSTCYTVVEYFPWNLRSFVAIVVPTPPGVSRQMSQFHSYASWCKSSEHSQSERSRNCVQIAVRKIVVIFETLHTECQHCNRRYKYFGFVRHKMRIVTFVKR